LKLIYVVIDGLGDRPSNVLDGKTPLEAADTPNLDFLAKMGKNGLMYTVRKGVAPESDVAVMSILGYDPFKFSTGRGVIEAIGADITLEDGDLALRCNFATVDSGKNILDRRAGRNLTRQETSELSRAINRSVELTSHPANFKFKSTTGHRAVLVIKSCKGSLSSNISNVDPAYQRVEGLGVVDEKAKMVLKECEPLDETEQAKVSAELLNEFVAKSHELLENHPVNLNRVSKGKLKANIVLTRDAGDSLPRFFNINKKYDLSFVSLTDMPVEKGLSKLVGMQADSLPPPSKDLKEDCKLRIKRLFKLLPKFDCFYIHIKGPDEPGHDGQFIIKRDMISVIDRYFIGEILQNVRLDDAIICVTADHSTPCALKTHSDDPVPLLICGKGIERDDVTSFSEKECGNGSLGLLQRGDMLMPKLVSFFKSAQG
jgi:2,3-bisphosphoglycerate-independent phosphoglycerate mutase